MKTALFLGAGASVCVRLPTTQGLLNNLREVHRKDEFILDVLKNETFTDIEIAYDSITEMIERIQPNERHLLMKKFEYKLSNGDHVPNETVIEKLWKLKSSIRNLLLDSLRIEPADVREVEPIYQKLETFIKEQGDDIFRIITINYDLAIETYCDHVEREVVDGFVRQKYGYKGYWNGKFKPESDNPIYLLKLHGSINWHSEYEDETTLVKIGDAGHHTPHYDLLIMPTHKEKGYRGSPFSTMVDRFKKTLNVIDVLIIIGYSYRDNELNKLIRERLDKDLIVISISLSSNDDTKKLGTAPFIIERDKIDEIDRRTRSGVYSYEVEFNQDTIGSICNVLNHIYSRLSPPDSSVSPDT